MTHERNGPTYSEDAQLATGWITARSWLAAILGLMSLAAGTIPARLALPRPVRLAALRQVRRAESLVRRLVLAMAVETPLPPPPPAPPGPDPKAPRVQVIPLRSLGLAQHWTPPPPRPLPRPDKRAASREPTRARPMTLRMVEPMPALAPPKWRPHGLPRKAPPPVASPDNPTLLRRVRALADVLSDPAPMARRMRRWLSQRSAMPEKLRRASPVTPGYHHAPRGSDDWRCIVRAEALARDRLWRRDRPDTS